MLVAHIQESSVLKSHDCAVSHITSISILKAFFAQNVVTFLIRNT